MIMPKVNRSRLSWMNSLITMPIHRVKENFFRVFFYVRDWNRLLGTTGIVIKRLKTRWGHVPTLPFTLLRNNPPDSFPQIA